MSDVLIILYSLAWGLTLAAAFLAGWWTHDHLSWVVRMVGLMPVLIGVLVIWIGRMETKDAALQAAASDTTPEPDRVEAT